MALVMLPCDLPWWPTLLRHLTKLLSIKHTVELIDGMTKIYELCNISLDPDDDDEKRDPDLFIGLLNFLDNELTCEERSNFLTKTLPNIVYRALQLKQWKPGGGLHFSLQQQSDCTELSYNFISSLIAHCFFSTFPRRTGKTHPTLQDFNFTYFFKYLSTNGQKAKLKSIFYYFDWLDMNENSKGSLKIHRQVMTNREWLTIEDWLECTLPLCPLQIKHEGKIERSDSGTLHICFSSAKVGGHVLSDGMTQECVTFSTFPELLALLLNIEALEDNEVLTIERVRNTARITNPKTRACLEKLENGRKMTVCCMDPEDYHQFPISQYEEDNILRELNKCLLGFQQKQTITSNTVNNNYNETVQKTIHLHPSRRLSPIGESVCSTPPELNNATNIIVTQASTSTNRSRTPPPPTPPGAKNKNVLKCDNASTRRGRFIVLGSSGECLPVSRRSTSIEPGKSIYDSCSSSEEEYHSAKTSLEDEDDPDFNRRYSIELDTAERRNTFAERLRDALRRETNSLTSSTDDSSYAVGISVAGSGLGDRDIKLHRGGSRGFILKEESMDEDLLKDSLKAQQNWIDKFKTKCNALNRTDTSDSSNYSFSTEYSSELEELYDQFSRWLDDPILETDTETKRKLDGRDLEVVKYAGSLLKRALSESFAGAPELMDNCPPPPNVVSDIRNDNDVDDIDNDEDTNLARRYVCNKKRHHRFVLSARSLSLELARHKHKLAAQLIEKQITAKQCKKRKRWVIDCVIEPIVQVLDEITITLRAPTTEKVSQLGNKQDVNGLKAIASGNWGCGASRDGAVQLKVILQWLAASVAGVPVLIYYTMGHQHLTTLDTLCRIIIDRKWTVKDLAQEMLNYATQYLHGNVANGTLFEDLIGVERTE